MYVIRETFVAKPGQASKLAKQMKEAMAAMPRGNGKTRVLTDFVGPFNTVVLETGDSCHYDGRAPHTLENCGSTPARVLIAATPATLEPSVRVTGPAAHHGKKRRQARFLLGSQPADASGLWRALRLGYPWQRG